MYERNPMQMYKTCKYFFCLREINYSGLWAQIAEVNSLGKEWFNLYLLIHQRI